MLLAAHFETFLIGISVSEQRLVYVTEELNNEKTLRDYNFISGGTMYLCMTLFAVILGGKTIVLRVSGDDTISDVKKKIQDREGIALIWSKDAAGRLF